MSYRNYRPSGLGGFGFLPPVVKNLMIINGLFFLATIVFGQTTRIDLYEVLGIRYWSSSEFRLHQVITHIFMHGDTMHLLSNMFALFMFGSTLERAWGAKRFVFFYFFTAIGAVILHQAVTGIEVLNAEMVFDTFRGSPTVGNYIDALEATRINNKDFTTFVDKLKSYNSSEVLNIEESSIAFQNVRDAIGGMKNSISYGASGAVFGILIAFGMLYPNTEIMLLFLPIPIKAKYFVAIFAAIELFSGIQNNPGDNIAHFAHLGGALFGFLLVKYWNKNNRKTFY